MYFELLVLPFLFIWGEKGPHLNKMVSNLKAENTWQNLNLIRLKP